MDNILNDIEFLKEKIDNEIETLGYYKELNYVCDKLKDELASYKYSLDDNLSILKYKAFLEVFLEQRIGYINKLIVDKQNKSIFDNRNESDLEKLDELKQSISSLLKYIEDNFPTIGKEVSIEYEKINNYYENAISYTINSTQRKFNMDINVKKEPVLSLYSDTSSVIKSYINKLTAFKLTYVENIKVFVDNDIKVKDLFKRAYETIKEPKALNAVKELELGYQNNIKECLENNNICTNTNILLIQENMIQNGLQIDKIIDKEKERNYYYQLITNMDLNYNNLEELLKLEEYVTSNHLYEEDFYKVLYALVEKEKYFSSKCIVVPSIYPKISDKSRVILEKMFIQNLKNLNDDEKEEIIIKLKRNGYYKVLDKIYEEYFDTNGFIIKADYHKSVNGYNNELDCKYVHKKLIESHYTIVNKKNGKVIDRIFDTIGDGEIFTNYGDVYQFSGKKIKPFRDYNYYYSFYTKDGRKIKPFKDKSKIIKRILDIYIIEKGEDKKAVDLDFNLLFEFKNFSPNHVMLVDNEKKNILIYDKDCLYLYDKYFHEIKKVNVKDIISNEDTFNDNSLVSIYSDSTIYNNGIVPLNVFCGKNRYIYYYDIINMKKVDLFTIGLTSNGTYGYSEGLYNYKDGNGFIGFKNLDGKIVIKPIFAFARPFLSGCSLAFSEDAENGFIDYQGHFKPLEDIVSGKHLRGCKNKNSLQYQIYDEDEHVTYSITANNNYDIDCDDKILEIDLNKNKVKRKAL